MRWLGFVCLNFATPIAFFLTFRAAGAKPAIALAIGVTVVQVLFHWIFRIRFSPFFIVASGFTVSLGAIDLLIASPRFFRLEPFGQNLVIGLAFWGSLLMRVPILSWFASALPEPIRPVLDGAMERYLRKVTAVWALYFVVKAFLFLWLAYRVDLGELVILRSIIGGGSLVLMFAGEVFYRKRIRKL